MLIDTHAHLADKIMIQQIPQLLIVAKSNDVKYIISIGCTIEEAKKSIRLAEENWRIFATVGLYPIDNKDDEYLSYPLNKRLEKIVELLKHPKVVAIGETGLDFSTPSRYEIERSQQDQIDLFESQIEIAKDVNLPVIIHSRNATPETLSIIKNHSDKVNFVWHCFTEGPQIAKEVIDTGCKISITPIITYKNAQNLVESVKIIPIESLMVETDSPFLVPHELKLEGVMFSEPANARIVAEKIAKIKNISFEEVSEKTSQNARKFFNIN